MVFHVFLLALAICYAKLVEYRLGYNYGQIFHDFSENSQTGVNGDSSETSSFDTYFTDRGAYFGGVSQRITLPLNDKTSTSLLLPSTFAISFWVLSEDTSGVIFYHYKDSNNYFYLQRYLTGRKIEFRLQSGDYDSTTLKASGNSFPYRIWNLITLVISQTTVNLYHDTLSVLTLILPSPYIESGTYSTTIGGSITPNSAFKGFIWYFIITSNIDFYLSLISTATSTTCLLSAHACNLPCNPALIDPYIGTGCLSTETNYLKDASGNSCSCDSFSCIGTECLSCLCSPLSCLFEDIKACYCDKGYYLDGLICKECESSCKTCEQADVCTECIAVNAFIDVIGCTCDNGYYGSKPLVNENSCSLCYDECLLCDTYDHCLSCTSQNSSPASSGCLCNNGFWSNNPLTSLNSCQPCFEECSTCTNYNICITCISYNAIPTSTGCFCNEGYWGLSPLNTETSCTLCYEECITCENYNQCSQCISLNSSPSITGCVCDPGYYGQHPLNLDISCIKCYNECLTCSDGQNCLTCVSENSTPSQNGGCICNNRYWNNTLLTESSSCKPCYEECSLCENDNQCIECIANNASPSIYGCQCNDGFWSQSPLINVLSCNTCYEECKTCSKANICKTCISDNSIPSSILGCLCKDGYYSTTALISYDSCIPCLNKCSKCDNGTNCTECKDPKALLGLFGQCECIGGYYYDENTEKCKICSAECLTCTDYQSCFTCSMLSSYNNYTNECSCIDGYFEYSSDPFRCKECTSNCTLCSSLDLCFKCSIKQVNIVSGICSCPYRSVLINNICKCEDGYWMDKNNNGDYFCTKCAGYCKTCSTYDYCLNCNGVYDIIGDNGQCITICNKGLYANNHKCIECPSLCEDCIDENSCVECSTNAEINNGTCVCQKGHEKIQGECKEKYFYGNLTVSSINKLKFEFTENPNLTLSLQDFRISSTLLEAFKPSFFIRNNSIYIINLNPQISIPDKTPINVEVLLNPLYSNENSMLYTYFYTNKLYELSLSQSDQSLATTASTTQATTQSTVSTSVAIAIVSNPAAAWALINTIQLIGYLPLGSNPLTPRLRVFCMSLGKYNILPNLMEKIFSKNDTKPPYLQGRNFGLDTSVFWINIGNTLCMFIIIILCWPCTFIVFQLSKGSVAAKAKKYLQNYKYNTFIRYWIQSYIDIVVYAIIQIKSEPQTAIGYVSLGSAVIFAVMFIKIMSIFTPAMILVCSFISKGRVLNTSDSEFYKKFGSLYYEFKMDKGFISSQFYFFYFIKRLAYALAQIFLNSVPYWQSAVGIMFSGIQLVFLIKYKPFKEWHILVSNVSGEVGIFIAFILSALFIEERTQEVSTQIEGVIIFVIISAMAIHSIVCIYCFVIELRSLWKRIEKSRALAFLHATQGNKKTINSTTNLQMQSKLFMNK
ncbi:hypothetical protein SteCoe_1964 [Stentor coeruleus]|uniref:EGF-like domain-containing protein n=1 Tax=Stentor coeruleus TaxID=5963 RepID=A0A1R2D0K1_9CILI|nr:hypothetical protein SteCoe_1964 [Stentor coeruleus]